RPTIIDSARAGSSSSPPKKDTPSKNSTGAEDGPARSDNEAKKVAIQGVLVRMVYDGSPAAEAGIHVGDRIIEINETKVESIDDAIGAVNNIAPGNKVVVRLMRGAQSMELSLTAARLPSNVPSELPSARESLTTIVKDAAAAAAEGEIR